MSLAILAGGSAITLPSLSLAQTKAVAPAAGGVRDELLEMPVEKEKLIPVGHAEEDLVQGVKGRSGKELPKELKEQEKKLLEAEQELLRRSKEGETALAKTDKLPNFVGEDEKMEGPAIHGAAAVDSSAPRADDDKKRSDTKKPEAVKNESKAAEKKQVVKAPAPEVTEEEEPAKKVRPQPKKKEVAVENSAPKRLAVESSDSSLQAKLGASERKVAQLSEELKQTRMKLMFAETEVERLASIIEARNQSTMQRYTGEKGRQDPGAEQPNYDDPPSLVRRAPGVQVAPSVQADGEMPLATVIVDKIYLRTGPGKSNSPLVSVTKGTKLLVETRQGEWYRVITPAGARAWVSSNGIAFGERGTVPAIGAGRKSPPPSQAEEQAEVEEKALELIRNR